MGERDAELATLNFATMGACGCGVADLRYSIGGISRFLFKYMRNWRPTSLSLYLDVSAAQGTGAPLEAGDSGRLYQAGHAPGDG